MWVRVPEVPHISFAGIVFLKIKRPPPAMAGFPQKIAPPPNGTTGMVPQCRTVITSSTCGRSVLMMKKKLHWCMTRRHYLRDTGSVSRNGELLLLIVWEIKTRGPLWTAIDSGTKVQLRTTDRRISAFQCTFKPGLSPAFCPGCLRGWSGGRIGIRVHVCCHQNRDNRWTDNCPQPIWTP